MKAKLNIFTPVQVSNTCQKGVLCNSAVVRFAHKPFLVHNLELNSLFFSQRSASARESAVYLLLHSPIACTRNINRRDPSYALPHTTPVTFGRHTTPILPVRSPFATGGQRLWKLHPHSGYKSLGATVGEDHYFFSETKRLTSGVQARREISRRKVSIETVTVHTVASKMQKKKKTTTYE